MENGKSLLKKQSQKVKHTKRMENNGHTCTPHLIQAIPNVEYTG